MKKTRDMAWHELYDRMCDDMCPICELLHHRICRSMDSFLYEGVNDRIQRAKIAASNGFCNYHAHMMMDMGDPLAHALIYSDLLGRAVDTINAPNEKKSPSSHQTHQNCLYCLQLKENESIYVEAFINSFSDVEFSEKYTDEALLCIPHLKLIKNFKKQKNVDEIKKITLNKYKVIMNNLSEIKRKSDYRFCHEPWTDPERSAWKKVVSILNARRGI